MHIVYWAHSYRDQDAAVNQHFGILIEEAARLIVNFDPPSQDLNAAKLEQNLRSCDGMVAVLTWRPAAPSPYILYEICMALRARKPVLVFLDDRLPDSTIPSNVLQRRFSHRTYFRQVRDHSHALNELKTYMGEQPGPRYQAGLGQRTCGTLGLRNLQRDRRETLGDIVESRGYRLLDLELMDLTNPLSFASFQYLNGLDVALRCVDSRTRRYSYWPARSTPPRCRPYPSLRMPATVLTTGSRASFNHEPSGKAATWRLLNWCRRSSISSSRTSSRSRIRRRSSATLACS
jgi:hypothetical protein